MANSILFSLAPHGYSECWLHLRPVTDRWGSVGCPLSVSVIGVDINDETGVVRCRYDQNHERTARNFIHEEAAVRGISAEEHMNALFTYVFVGGVHKSSDGGYDVHLMLPARLHEAQLDFLLSRGVPVDLLQG